MPNILRKPLIKPLREIQIGELFKMPLRNSWALCLLLDEAGPRRLLGIISSPEAGHPFFLRAENDMIACVSYGSEWVIDPEAGEESFVHPHFFEDEIGTIRISADDAWMRFDPPLGVNDFDMGNFSLLGHGEFDRNTQAVPYRQWSIWQSDEERNSRHGQPLVRIVGRSARPDVQP
ncbi:hypothetical protein [Aureimonas frigidaquae]|uniref:hypothetical protein n=1 Tax=Aureimonas frigidaquae TaxID=424757 RepID=UPI0012ED85FF|nr:hypothetical protein [Aureimonas frigidaquae]